MENIVETKMKVPTWRKIRVVMLILAETADFWNVVLLKIVIFNSFFDEIFDKIKIFPILTIFLI